MAKPCGSPHDDNDGTPDKPIASVSTGSHISHRCLTPYYKEVDTLNNFIGGPFYSQVNSPSDGTWWSEMNSDEGGGHVPAIFGANTTNLPGWGNETGLTHIITVTSVGVNGNGSIKYYDTAPYFSSGSHYTLGFHNVTRGSVEQNGGLYVSIW